MHDYFSPDCYASDCITACKKEITIYDPANQFSVSTATVSRALNNDPVVRKKTRKAIQEAARELGDRRKAGYDLIIAHPLVFVDRVEEHGDATRLIIGNYTVGIQGHTSFLKLSIN